MLIVDIQESHKEGLMGGAKTSAKTADVFRVLKQNHVWADIKS